MDKKQQENYEADLNSGVVAFDTKNFAMAYQLLSPLAIMGDAESLWRIGMMQMNSLGMVENRKLGFENFIKAADQGHEIAHHMIGVAYMNGEGTEKNAAKAIKWFERAAEFSLPGSMYALSALYTYGDGVEIDLDKSKEWESRAEELLN